MNSERYYLKPKNVLRARKIISETKIISGLLSNSNIPYRKSHPKWESGRIWTKCGFTLKQWKLACGKWRSFKKNSNYNETIY